MLMVEKFGGTSVANALRIRNAAARLIEAARQGYQVVAVVSAQCSLQKVLQVEQKRWV